MKEEYVSYEQSKALKELGFDWPCDHYYCAFDNETDVRFWGIHPPQSSNTFRQPDNKVIADAPTQALAAKWLREVKGIHPFPDINCTRQWYARAIDLKTLDDVIWDGGMFPTYEATMSHSLTVILDRLTANRCSEGVWNFLNEKK